MGERSQEATFVPEYPDLELYVDVTCVQPEAACCFPDGTCTTAT